MILLAALVIVGDASLNARKAKAYIFALLHY